jgi:hypothetical protein
MGQLAWPKRHSTWLVHLVVCATKANDLVMIVSYETLRTLQDELAGAPIGLLLADEGHRLKNAGKLLPADRFQGLS